MSTLNTLWPMGRPHRLLTFQVIVFRLLKDNHLKSLEALLISFPNTKRISSWSVILILIIHLYIYLITSKPFVANDVEGP